MVTSKEKLITESNVTQNMLQNSQIYVDINKIINAYNKSLEIVKDDLFCVPVSDSKDEKKFSLNKYLEARKLYLSGKIQSEVKQLDSKIKTHRYIISKNRERDKADLQQLQEKLDKIKSCICFIDTKNEWTNILDDNFPDRDKASYEHSMGYFVEIYKELSTTMELTCSRHIGDPEFVYKLNNMIENDMINGNVEEGKTDLKFAVLNRKKFTNALDRNVAKFIQSENDYINEKI